MQSLSGEVAGEEFGLFEDGLGGLFPFVGRVADSGGEISSTLQGSNAARLRRRPLRGRGGIGGELAAEKRPSQNPHA